MVRYYCIFARAIAKFADEGVPEFGGQTEGLDDHVNRSCTFLDAPTERHVGADARLIVGNIVFVGQRRAQRVTFAQ